MSVRNAGLLNVGDALNELVQHIANVAETYSSVIFSVKPGEQKLIVHSYHTLSREFIPQAEVPFGAGFVGWVAENLQRVAVAPFQHGAKSLRYYSQEQELKSFLALPILDDRKRLLGVLACDSKKSYAFSQLTEKLLHDCTKQAARWFLAGMSAGIDSGLRDPSDDKLAPFIERLRNCDDEKSLLTLAAEIPIEIVNRDALVVLSLADRGVGEGAFYTQANQSRVGNRLLDHVLQRAKVFCPDRKLLSTPSDDLQKRTFLSVPFSVLRKEAGSMSLLSIPQEGFRPREISAVERIAQVVGRELERVRLREQALSGVNGQSILAYKAFALRSKALLQNAKAGTSELAFVRVGIKDTTELELILGANECRLLLSHLPRMVEQSTVAHALICQLFDGQVLVCVEAAEGARMISRLKSICKTFSLSATESLSRRPEWAGSETGDPVLRHGKLLLERLVFGSVTAPNESKDFDVLVAKTLQRSGLIPERILAEQPLERAVNAGRR